MRADDLTRESLGLIGAKLRDRGWSRVSRTAGQFEQAVSEQITARLDFAVAKYDRPVRAKVTPYVGVAHKQVEEVRRQVFGRSSYTINMQIQQLMQDRDAERRWMFTDLGSEGTATRVVADSLEYGWPFIERFNNLHDIIVGLEGTNRGKRMVMSHSLTIAYCLEGRLDDAIREFAPDVDFLKENPAFPGLDYVRRMIDMFHLPVTV
jgi:hypothetical protein